MLGIVELSYRYSRAVLITVQYHIANLIKAIVNQNKKFKHTSIKVIKLIIYNKNSLGASHAHYPLKSFLFK